VWEVAMVGFHMMHQGARRTVFPATREKGVGTRLMFAVRSIFADPPRIAREMRALAERGLVQPWLGESDDPLGFLIHEGGAETLTEAAYRFARHEPGVDVTLFGTGDSEHLRANVRALFEAAAAGSGPGEARGAVRASGRRGVGLAPRPGGRGGNICALSHWERATRNLRRRRMGEGSQTHH
jgi:hypothetical protein